MCAKKIFLVTRIKYKIDIEIEMAEMRATNYIGINHETVREY